MELVNDALHFPRPFRRVIWNKIESLVKRARFMSFNDSGYFMTRNNRLPKLLGQCTM